MEDVKASLLVLGDFAWNLLIRTNSELLPGGDTFGEVLLTPGGTAANVAVWATRCGLLTSFVGKVGRDSLGELAQEDLGDERVTAHLIRTNAHPTAAVAVWIDQRGERSMVSGQGADFYLLPSELPKRVIASAHHLHLSAWSFFTDPPRAAAREAARIVKAAGGGVSFDPGSFQLIREGSVDRFLRGTQDLDIDLLFPNLEEGQVLSGEREPERVAKVLAELYAGATVALKLNDEGALLFQDGRSTHIPPTPSHPIDATGAGDAFAGAFLARYLQGASVIQAAHFATRISAWVIEQVGARPKPDARLERLLRAAS